MSIKIDLKIFLFLFLFVLTSQIETYIVLLIFAIIHELGHLLMGVILKFKAEEIKLTPVGLQIKFKSNYIKEKNSDKIKINKMSLRRAVIALAGPLTNVLIAIILICIGNLNINFQNSKIFQVLVYSNFLIAIFNLIPIYPMDGGRFLKELITIFYGEKKAYQITYLISKTILILCTAMASIIILYIHNISIIIILGYLWYIEIREIRKYNRRRKIQKIIKEENKILQKTSNSN